MRGEKGERRVVGLESSHGKMRLCNSFQRPFLIAGLAATQSVSFRSHFCFNCQVGWQEYSEFMQAEKQQQEMAEACKRLIKNCIICWNYLYLSQKLADLDDATNR